ncbi:BAG domain-containing protein Samui isoform X2 [Parasteatoda tepidariorum]|nr:BAG domain-containing protein Samui isoform X2 [Parasteatoda tepidariorum]
MTWSPNRHFRSPGSSPETYRRIIRNEDDFPNRNKDAEDEFFNGRKSPTFPRRVFKEVWNESPTTHRFTERPRMFKRVFRPDRWEDEFDRDIPHLRRVEREFDRNFDGGGPTRKFDEGFEKRFNSRDFKKSLDDESPDAKVHHIPIMVERRMDDLKSRFAKNEKSSPSQERNNDEEYAEEWQGPQVQRLRKSFEEPEDEYSSRFNNYRVPKFDTNSKPRPYINPSTETWDPHAIHTLPTRKSHKSSQSFDDSRHPVPPKSVFRSYSETHDDAPRPQQQQHSAAFRSHSDGHCPQQTYVTKINVNLPSQNENDEQCSPSSQSKKEFAKCNGDSTGHAVNDEDTSSKSKGRNKYTNPSMQQIAVVLQNVEDLVTRVENYTGTGRDKHYRFLDEMLTRCMLRLDDVDTEGKEDIRNARKAALREVQSCIDRLEAKADESERRAREKKAMENEKPVQQNKASPIESDIKNKENQADEKKAIPLQAKSDDDEHNPSKAIPLPDASSDGSQVSRAIPLKDKPTEAVNNQPKSKAIPLGYTPTNNNPDSDSLDKPKTDFLKNEQTKL